MADRIARINDLAQKNFNKAQGMLDMLNEIYGTNFGWLHKRVTLIENGEIHDAWAHMVVNMK